jgi:hypothetical protein
MALVNAVDISLKVSSDPTVLDTSSVLIWHSVADPNVIRNAHRCLRWYHTGEHLNDAGAKLTLALRLLVSRYFIEQVIELGVKSKLQSTYQGKLHHVEKLVVYFLADLVGSYLELYFVVGQNEFASVQPQEWQCLPVNKLMVHDEFHVHLEASSLNLSGKIIPLFTLLFIKAPFG